MAQKVGRREIYSPLSPPSTMMHSRCDAIRFYTMNINFSTCSARNFTVSKRLARIKTVMSKSLSKERLFSIADTRYSQVPSKTPTGPYLVALYIKT